MSSREIAVPVPGHAHYAPDALARIAADFGLLATTAGSLPAALAQVDAPQVVLIAGSLYLAGEALAANGEPPA